MMKLIPVVFFFLLSTCSSIKKTEVVSSENIRIYYNNDNIGYMEPCGCRISPIGGLFRRWNAMDGVPKSSRIYVDAGNMLFKSNQPADYLIPQWYEQARGVIEGYNILGADAVALGEADFGLGIEKLAELQKLANFPFISSNIVWKKNGELFAKDSVILERQGKKIGVFAVFNPTFQLPSELSAKDPSQTIREQVQKLKGQGADMIVLLSHSGYDEDVKIAKASSGIDLIVGAHSQSLLQKPDVENGTLIVQLSSQGQMLGYVDYAREAFPKKRVEFVVAELNNDYDEPLVKTSSANPMKNLLAVTNLRIGEANRKLDEKIWAAEEKKSPDYDTSISCRDCHQKQAQFHDAKPHAAAFLTLVSGGQEGNMECIKCHSVGFRERGGFSGLENAFLDSANKPIDWEAIHKKLPKTVAKKGVSYRANAQAIKSDVPVWQQTLASSGVKKSFVTVQCENCHGPKAGHPFGGDTKAVEKISTALCVKCHTLEQAPNWYTKSGQLNEKVAKAALKSMTCPR